MRDFENPNKQLKFRKVPYQLMKENEKTYTIYNMYRLGILQGEDVRDLVYKSVWSNLSFYAYPILFYSLFKKPFARFTPKSVNHWSTHNRNALFAGSLVASWIVFSHVDPLNAIYEKEKVKVLDYIDMNMANQIYRYNAMLPRYWTESRMNWFLVREFIKRRSFGNGILCAPEGTKGTHYFPKEIPLKD